MFAKKAFPRAGQWVQFSLPPAAHAAAEAFGAWRQRGNLWVGVFAGESRTPEGVVVLPARIMLVNEKGHNVPGVVHGHVTHGMWVLCPWHAGGGAPDSLAENGCLGVCDSPAPVTHREDVPPGRRPENHPLP